MSRFIIILLLIASFAESIENSIIPVMESFEAIENISQSKLTVRQLQEIREALSNKGHRIRLMSYNMLFNVYDHNLKEINRWEQRLPRIVELIREANPDVINSQELWPEQLAALAAELPEYSYFANPEKETYAIFFKKDRFELLDQSFASPLAHVQLKDILTGKTLSVFNTHLAFSNMEKREKQAIEIAEKIANAKNCPILFSGDLNTFPAWLENETFPFFDGDHILRIFSSKGLKNARELSLLGHFGPISTFTNSPGGIEPFQGTGTPGVFLDHIFVSAGILILAHATHPGTVDGHYPSDHMPILVDFLITF